MIRVKNKGENGTYFEQRTGCGSANSYLVLAATVAAGLDGLKKKIEPGAPELVDVSKALELPKSLGEALDALSEDNVLVEALGPAFVRWFCTMKRAEIKAIHSTEGVPLDDEALLQREREVYMRFL